MTAAAAFQVRDTAMPWAVRRELIGLCFVMAMLSGCADEPGETRTATDPSNDVVFCSHGVQEYSGSKLVFAIHGCPERLIKGSAPLDDEGSVPQNSTGLRFSFEMSAAEPGMTATIHVTNGSRVLLDDELHFRAGRLVDRDVSSDTDTTSMTVITTLHLSTCSATRLVVSWTPSPLAAAATIDVTSFNDADKENSARDGVVTCNGYWEARP